MLKKQDKEFEARGLRFTRYANGCAIAVKSESSAKRVDKWLRPGSYENSNDRIDAHLRTGLAVRAISKEVVAKAGHETWYAAYQGQPADSRIRLKSSLQLVPYPARNDTASTAYFAICRVVVSQRRTHSASFLRLAGWQNIQHWQYRFWLDVALEYNSEYL